MTKVKKRTIIELVIFIGILIICLFYLWSKATKAAYESEVEKDVSIPIAGWKISVDGQDITTEEEKEISISEIEWDTSRTRTGKVSPGSTGTMTINIDPTGTETAIKYQLEIIDKTVNPDSVLKVTNVSSTNTTINKNNNIYTGYVYLNDINNGLKPQIIVDVEWENDDSINDLEREISSQEDYLLIKFKATQYKGS